MKKILITGGCGFIGTSLISSLLKNFDGLKIIILDNFEVGTSDDLAEVSDFKMVTTELLKNEVLSGLAQVVLVEGDIRDASTVDLCAVGMDAIVHLAANTGVGPSVEDPRLDMEYNVIGVFNTLEAARLNEVGKFVFASSGAPAGEVSPPIHEELPPHPVSPYGASKLAGEGYCSSYFRTFGIDTVCLRFGNVYGPRSKNKSSVVAKFIKQAVDGENSVIYGDGKQTRDFIYITDLVKAIELALTNNVGGEVFQIATGKEHTVDEVSMLIKSYLKKKGVNMSISYEEPRLGDVLRNYSDTSKAKRMLGWTTTTELIDGISRTIDSFLQK